MANKNELLPFATGEGALIVAPAAYESLDERVQGFHNGIANPDTANTAIRHATVAASMIGLFTAKNGPADVLDDGDVTGFEVQFEAALAAYFASKIPANLFHYGIDTGTLNRIVVPTIYPALAIRPNGFTVAVKIKVANVYPGTVPPGDPDPWVTLKVGSSAEVRVTRPDGTDLQTGDLVVNQVAVFTYDGTRYRMISPSASATSGGGGGGGDGLPGADGTKWYRGATAPDAGLGVEGDFYLNTASGDVYQKVSGAWEAIFNMKGADGADAPTPSVLSKTSASTLTATHFNWLIKLTGTTNFTTTLPSPINTGGKGRFLVWNGATATTKTLATPAGTFIGPRGSGAATLSINAGETILLVSDGVGWVAGVVCSKDDPLPSSLTVTAATTLVTTHFNWHIKLAGTTTFTTTLPTPVGSGGVGRFFIWNSSASSRSIATPAGTFVGPRGSAAATLSIAAGDAVFVISDGANWVVEQFCSSRPQVPDWLGVGCLVFALGLYGAFQEGTVVNGPVIGRAASTTWRCHGMSGTYVTAEGGYSSTETLYMFQRLT